MARLEPFSAIRYSDAAGPLDTCIAPPYDVVDPTERERLARRSVHNAIHLELPEPDLSSGLDRYGHAASLWREWRREGALQHEGEPALFIYRMDYPVPGGERRATTGVLGALEIDHGQVLPHEQTMPSPKGDRLELLRACRANLSPIWGLSVADGLGRACDEIAALEPLTARATDDEGVVHELFAVRDATSIDRVAKLIATAPVVLADGHHRFATAASYRDERRAATGQHHGDFDYVLALVVELTGDRLNVQAIHRVLNGPADLDIETLLSVLRRRFSVLPGPPGRLDPAEISAAMRAEGGLALIHGATSYLCTPRLTADDHAAFDSASLDRTLGELEGVEVSYLHDPSSVVEAVVEGRVPAGFLLRPPTIEQIAATAYGGTRMPAKTTFFWPKPRTGMAFRPVEQ
jgi:uncharacterized protein (DUF1015 family)